MKRLAATLLVLAAFLLVLAMPAGAAELTYRTPPQVVADLLTAPRMPRGAPRVSPDGRYMLLVDEPSLVPIALLAEPVVKLAGLEVLPEMWAERRDLKRASTGFSVVRLSDAARVRARLPEGASVGDLAWSPDGSRVACILYAKGGAELWVVDAADGAARRVPSVRLTTVVGEGLVWSLDGSAIFCTLVPAAPPELPAEERAPAGPQLREGRGRATAQRTAREVLRTAEDRQRFAHFATAQLARVAVADGSVRLVGTPRVFFGWRVSPEDRYVAVAWNAEQPLGFPYMLFPSVSEVWSVSGARVARIGESPLNDRSAVSSVAALGPRNLNWSPDGGSLWFCSWKDAPGADPKAAIKDPQLPPPGTDQLMCLDAPFTGEARVVAESDFAIDGMIWTAEGKRLLLDAGYRPRRRTRLLCLDPARPERRTVLVDRSTESVQEDPGDLLAMPGRRVPMAWTSPDGKAVYLARSPLASDGRRPFLDRMDLETGRKQRLFESETGRLELPVALLDGQGRRFITARESNREPRNYWLRRAGQKRALRLSDIPDPAPALTAAQRVPFKFTRPDSVVLNAEAVLPADWKPGRALPTIFWIYPNDYRSAAAASELRRSPDRFPSQSALNPEVLVTQGYAVVYPDLAVVGTNDRYVEELRKSAQAALDECVRRGFTDPKRVGVGGHSYGAFSTANALAHTDLFRAGVASDGAYNRTLTPFTFQAEERNLWEARDTYLQMSPFLHADRIDEPLLLLHNLDDANVGTNPIQSERMFEALNGLGKTTALVQYPFEDHGPAARETVLDYWARVIEWFDRYVKNAGSQATSAPMGGTQP